MSDFVPILIGERVERADEHDTLETAERVAESLVRLNRVTEIIEVALDLAALDTLAGRGPTVVFNLVESIGGDASAIALPCRAMDRMGLRYTGVQSEALEDSTSKLKSKAMLRIFNIPTPRWWTDGHGIPDDQEVIIKSDLEHGSLGIDAGSVVPGQQAENEIKARQAKFGGHFFAEEFLPGREFNIALLEQGNCPTVLPIAEMKFGGYAHGRPRIVDFTAKWDPTDPAYSQSRGEFGLGVAEPGLATCLKQTALACWKAFSLSGYARIDFRLSASGTPSVIDINANPCLAPDAGFSRSALQAGFSYHEIVDNILRAATGPRSAR